MLLEKEEYKKLKKPYKLSSNNIIATVACNGHTGINTLSVNICFTEIGLFIEPLLSQKAFIDYTKVTNIDIDSNKLFIESTDTDARHIELTFGKKDFKNINRAFYLVREKMGASIPDSLKRDINLPISKGSLSINVVEQKKEMMNNNQIFCPKCLSTQITALNSRPSFLNGYSSTMITCLNCGHKFKPGQK